MAKNFVFPDGTGVAAEMRRAPAFGKVNIGKLIVEAPVKERRNIVEVPLSAIIRSSPFQTRRSFDPEIHAKDQALVESIEALGQSEPVCLKLIEPGDYEIVWGHRRIAALRHLNQLTVLAIIIRGDLQETATWTALENTGEPLSPIEKAELADLLEKEFHYSIGEIAVRLGCTKREVQRFRKILAADAMVRFALQEETITLRLALALAAAPREHQPRLLEIVLQNRSGLNDTRCHELVQQMVSGACSPDNAAMIFGLTLPVGGETVPLNAAPIESASPTPSIVLKDETILANAKATALEPSIAPDVHRADVEDAGINGAPHQPALTPAIRSPAKLDPAAVTTMLQHEQIRIDPALLREVTYQGVERGLSTREIRLAVLLAHSHPPTVALDDAAVLKSDRSARLVSEVSERLGQLRHLSRRGGCSGQTETLLQALAKEIGALLEEITGPTRDA